MNKLIIAFAIVFAALTSTVQAKLCKDCQGKMVVMAIGKCSDCNGMTSSSAYKHCKACSAKKGECQLCGKAMGAKEVTREPAKNGDLVSANNANAVDLYAQLSSEKGNVFISPYSITSAMSMVYSGARDNTAAEMAKALNLSIPQKDLPAAFKALNATLHANASTSGQRLSIANGICLTGGDVSKAYKALLTDSYDAEIVNGDLKAINGWVKKKTEGKIEKILDELNPNSVCVLLNAIYFKGSWDQAFDKKRTHDGHFKVTAATKVKVPMMYQKANFKMVAKTGFQMIALPYKGEKASMVVLLPSAVDGLPELEKRLSADVLSGWLKDLDRQPGTKIMLSLPRFKLETNYDLVPPYKTMGMSDAFTMTKADFSGMGWKKGSLCISQIKHKAVVEVNEEGTEAAAATAVEMATKSERRYPVFRADHPFLFLIRDNSTGTILFMGRVIDPTAK